MSERIPVSRDRTGATVDPHRLTAIAWAVVRHAGRTPGWSGDLAAHDLVCPRQSASFLRSRLSHSWHRERQCERQRCQKVFHLHRSVRRCRRLIAKAGWPRLSKSDHRAARECQLEITTMHGTAIKFGLNRQAPSQRWRLCKCARFQTRAKRTSTKLAT